MKEVESDNASERAIIDECATLVTPEERLFGVFAVSAALSAGFEQLCEAEQSSSVQLHSSDFEERVRALFADGGYF